MPSTIRPLASALALSLLAACTQAPTPTAQQPAPAAPAPSGPATVAANPPGMQDGQPGAPGTAMPVAPGSDASATPATDTAAPVVAAAAESTLAKDDPLRAQVLLERAFFSPGEIDGAKGTNMARAVKAYQAAHDLKPSGTLDSATWDALNQDSAPVLVEYTLSADDVAGPFDKTPAKTADMAKKDALPYESALEKVAEKLHMAPALLKKLNPDVDFAGAGDAGKAADAKATSKTPTEASAATSTALAGSKITVINVAAAEKFPTPAKIVVDKSDSTLLLVDASDKTLGVFPVTTGSAQFPLPIGEWKVTTVQEDPVWHFDPKLIAGSKKTDKEADVPAGPNNPVGAVWIGLTKEHYGIHGTPHPERIGKTESNGCIRMTNWSVEALSKVASKGMQVTMRE
jgi:lipoprotein-anchoring transpeptidase ErfK/SrfK